MNNNGNTLGSFNDVKENNKKIGRYSYSTLKNWKKDDLIDYARIINFNLEGSQWGNEMIRRRLEKACKYLQEKVGLSLKDINWIIKLEEENWGKRENDKDE